MYMKLVESFKKYNKKTYIVGLATLSVALLVNETMQFFTYISQSLLLLTFSAILLIAIVNYLVKIRIWEEKS